MGTDPTAGDASSVEPTPADGEVVTRYRRRAIGPAELQLIRDKIEQHGGRPRTRKAIATAICNAWDWRQPRGNLATRACGDLLLRLQDWGHIELPSTRAGTNAPRPRRPVLPDDLIPLTGLEVRDGDADLDSLVVRPITPEEREGWRRYMDRYHYLGYRPIVGEHLLYAAFLGGELVALLAWASPALNAPLREAYVGWDAPTKRERLHFVADNVRFLVLPWVRVRHLASKILAYNLRRLSADWQQTWGHPIYLAESFVDMTRFRGTCYRASNWIYLGQTAGRSKRGNAYLPGRPKGLYVYPLRRDARRLLCAGGQASAGAIPSAVSPVMDETTDSPVSVAAGEAQGDALAAAANPGVQDVERSGQPDPQAGLAITTSALIAFGAAGHGTECDAAATDAPNVIASRPAPLQAAEPGGEPPAVGSNEAEDDGSALLAADASQREGRRTRRTRLRIELTETEKTDLQILARGHMFPHSIVLRAKAILYLAEGDTLAAAARKVGRGRRHIRKWAERFARKRLRGLEDALRTGRPARFSPRSRDGACQDSLRASR